MKEIKRVAIVGLGALGASYARRIAKNAPDIDLFGVVQDVETFWGSPIIINGKPLKINYRTIETLKQIPLDLVMVCVKSYELENALEDLTEIIGPKTLIMGFSCGLDTADILVERFGKDRVIPCVANGADISRTGRYIAIDTTGEICFGRFDETTDESVKAIDEFLLKAYLRHEYVQNITEVIWRQYMLDVCVGQTAAVYQMTYGELLRSDKALDTLYDSCKEIVKLANAIGVALTDRDINLCQKSFSKYPSYARSVMLQDYWLNRRLETEVLCDKVIEMAKENELRLPVHEWLRDEIHKLVIKGNLKPAEEGQPIIMASRSNFVPTSDYIATQIRMEILKGKYAAGAKIKETEIAQQYEASRSTVRTALQILSDEGILNTLPNGRREILHFGEKEISDLFEMRLLLETSALQTILRQNNVDLTPLENAFAEIEKKYRFQSTKDWNELDILFHSALVDAAGNTFISNSFKKYCSLWYTITGFSHPLRRENSYPSHFYGDHEKLIQLIRNKDKLAIAVLKAHVLSGKEEALLISGFKV